MPLPAPSKSKQHHPALPFDQAPDFMSDLRKRDGISARALEFTILTAARTSDTIDARWDEIDLDAAIWRISDGRHKTGKVFEIPLSRRAIEILDRAPRVPGGYVFPGAKPRRPLSNVAMLKVTRSMRYPSTTRGKICVPHGFRSTFRDWAGDRTDFPREVIEAAMSHQIPDKAEAAYRRSTALEKRRELMEEWARYCGRGETALDDNMELALAKGSICTPAPSADAVSRANAFLSHFLKKR